MPQSRTIYADHAATSWPKPPMVIAAIADYMAEVGVAAGRGQSSRSEAAARLVRSCRLRLANLFGVAEPSRVVFTAGGTDSLNLVIRGLLRAGDAAACSQIDHNAVLRPLHSVVGDKRCVAAADRDSLIDRQRWAFACRGSRLACINHASNVTGTIQPVTELVDIARRHGAAILLDACQTAGMLPIDVDREGYDYVAFGAHKGLLGPLGLGVLLIGPNAEIPCPLRRGGTGSDSELAGMPTTLPDTLEAGSLNVPAIAGLAAALDAPRSSLDLEPLDETLAAGDWLVYGGGERLPTRCVAHPGMKPAELAATLESVGGLETRAGLHCAPLAHQALGSSGAVRISFGGTSLQSDVEAAAETLREVDAELRLLA